MRLPGRRRDEVEFRTPILTKEGEAAVAAILAQNGNREEAEARFDAMVEEFRGHPLDQALLALQSAHALYSGSRRPSDIMKMCDRIRDARGILLGVPPAEQDEAYWHLHRLVETSFDRARNVRAESILSIADTVEIEWPALRQAEPLELVAGEEVPLRAVASEVGGWPEAS